VIIINIRTKVKTQILLNYNDHLLDDTAMKNKHLRAIELLVLVTILKQERIVQLIIGLRK
jgi:hypothetical protein